MAKQYFGSCHCGKVKFEVECNILEEGYLICNCSYCHKANKFTVMANPISSFHITSGNKVVCRNLVSKYIFRKR